MSRLLTVSGFARQGADPKGGSTRQGPSGVRRLRGKTSDVRAGTNTIEETLDIGGEGRYLDAWNLNPNETKTLGLGKGTAIPRRIDGRAEAIPLPDRSVGSIIMERTPLRRCAIAELLRIVQRGGTIVLRHHVSNHHDPHVWAHRLIPVRADIRLFKLGNQQLQESKYDLGRMPKQITQRE